MDDMPELSASLMPKGFTDAPGHFTFGAELVSDTKVRLYSAKLAGSSSKLHVASAGGSSAPAASSLSAATCPTPDRRSKIQSRTVTVQDAAEGAKLVAAIRVRFHELIGCGAATPGLTAVSSDASAAPAAARRVLAVLSPHSGKRKAVPTFKKRIAPLLQAAGVDAHVVTTNRSRHALDMGAAFLLSHPAVADQAPAAAAAAASAAGGALPWCPDGILFLSGDGTVQEFVNGMLAGADAALAEGASAELLAAVVAHLPICLVPAGTQNALARGMKTLTPESGALALIFGVKRGFDALRVVNGSGQEVVSLCGLGWGIPSAIARDSEAWRRWGTARYALLKIVHGLRAGLGLQKFNAQVAVCGDASLASASTSPLLQHMAARGSVVAAGIRSAPVVSSAPSDVTVSSGLASAPNDSSASLLSGTGLQLDSPDVRPGSSAGGQGVESQQGGVVPCVEEPRDADCAGVLLSVPPGGAEPAHTRLEALPLQPLVECKTDCQTCSKRSLASHSRDSDGAHGESTAAAGASASEKALPAPLQQDTQWRYAETGDFIALGAINTSPDARFCHGGDGRLDVVIARRGGLLRSFALMARYVGRTVGIKTLDERASPLFDYVKAGSMSIRPQLPQPTAGAAASGKRPSPAEGANVDGEFFLGPGPFTVSVIPRMLTVYGFA